MERDFKGVWIPKEVWLDNRLNALDKVILAEVDSLDQSDRGCYASNQYIAEFCQCSVTKVSTSISKLIEYGYLFVQKFDGRERQLKSRLSNFERQDFKNCKAGIQILKESNIENNAVTNTSNKDIPYGRIIEYLNKRTGSSYRASSKKTKDLIRARFNEGFIEEDFYKVIDNKTADWISDNHMSKFLRPETLFGTKFESYLNQKAREMTTKDLADKMDFSGFMEF